MKAMIITDFGGPEVFQKDNREAPHPAADEVLVRIHATSVNPVDYKIRQSGSWAGVVPPSVIGYDASGVIEAVGDAVKAFKVGDEVFFTPEVFGNNGGTYAEYAVVRAAIVAEKPHNLSHLEAAALPLAGGTAWDALIERGRLGVGQSVLIHGAAGGVGSFAVQIARAAGAFVYATCGSYDAAEVKQLGADRVIDYRNEDFVQVIERETDRRGVDVVLDTVGNGTLPRSLQVVRSHGQAVTVVGTDESLNAAFLKNITVHFLFLQRGREKLEALKRLAQRRQLRPLIGREMALEEVGEAHRILQQGGEGIRGKIVLSVD